MNSDFGDASVKSYPNGERAIFQGRYPRPASADGPLPSQTNPTSISHHLKPGRSLRSASPNQLELLQEVDFLGVELPQASEGEPYRTVFLRSTCQSCVSEELILGKVRKGCA